tara:strand:- start:380 stop:733 length:354 start_codon:yes stop_codon:yes gene_type:complete
MSSENKPYDSTFDELLQYWPELHEELSLSVRLLLNKGFDYSDSKYGRLGNLGASEEIGIEPWKAIIIRMLDKWTRLKTFVREETYKVKDESFEDTIRDLGNYCFLCLVTIKTNRPSK